MSIDLFRSFTQEQLGEAGDAAIEQLAKDLRDHPGAVVTVSEIPAIVSALIVPTATYKVVWATEEAHLPVAQNTLCIHAGQVFPAFCVVTVATPGNLTVCGYGETVTTAYLRCLLGI